MSSVFSGRRSVLKKVDRRDPPLAAAGSSSREASRFANRQLHYVMASKQCKLNCIYLLRLIPFSRKYVCL